MVNVLPVAISSDAREHSWSVLIRSWPQPLIGTVVSLAALVLVGVAAALSRPVLPDASRLALLVVLAASIAASRLWPLHVGSGTRICIADVPLYLLVCLFSPIVAAVGVGIGMLAGEVLICRRCMNTAGDIGSQVGRWALLAFGVSSVVSLSTSQNWLFYGSAAALLLWVGDVLSCPVVFCPITRKDPLATMVAMVKRSWAIEMMQYLIAMLGLLALGSTRAGVGFEWLDGMRIILIVLPCALLSVYVRREDALQRALRSIDATETHTTGTRSTTVVGWSSSPDAGTLHDEHDPQGVVVGQLSASMDPSWMRKVAADWTAREMTDYETAVTAGRNGDARAQAEWTAWQEWMWNQSSARSRPS